MRPDAAEADRRQEVRAAARGWRRASAIDDATLAAVLAAYPDDRVRLGPAFRTLAFVFTFLALNAAFFLVMSVLEPRIGPASALAVLFGIALCTLTEVQTGALKRADGGTETATSFVGLGYLIAGFAFLLSDAGMPDRVVIRWVLAVGVVVLAAAAWRWGQAACAAMAGLSFYLLLAQAPIGRLLWIVAALVTVASLFRAEESRRLPPAHRRSLQSVLGLSLLALYLALNLWSWDEGLIESMTQWTAHGLRDSALRPLAVAGTAVVPAAVIALGVWFRRRLFLDLGFLLAVASLVTLRRYVHVAPLWVVLTLGGAAAIFGALALRRFLAGGPRQERGGFTAEPLFEDLSRQGALEAAAALSAVPGVRHAPADASLKPGGGRFGGGGASGEY